MCIFFSAQIVHIQIPVPGVFTYLPVHSLCLGRSCPPFQSSSFQTCLNL
jgi:hypothetical protein